jgi:hypothetical protein
MNGQANPAAHHHVARQRRTQNAPQHYPGGWAPRSAASWIAHRKAQRVPGWTADRQLERAGWPLVRFLFLVPGRSPEARRAIARHL